MNRERQAELLAQIREELGEPEIRHPKPGVVKILIADKHDHDELGNPREFSVEGLSILDAAEKMLKNTDRARDGAFCTPECINYRPPNDSDL